MRVFIDIDDTLILWDDEDRANPNEDLIEAINAFAHARPTDLIMVWSGGGIDYAAMWARTCIPEVSWLVVPKYVTYPEAHDLCIDDVLGLQVACEVISPNAGIERLRALAQLAS